MSYQQLELDDVIALLEHSFDAQNQEDQLRLLHIFNSQSKRALFLKLHKLVLGFPRELENALKPSFPVETKLRSKGLFKQGELSDSEFESLRIFFRDFSLLMADKNTHPFEAIMVAMISVPYVLETYTNSIEERKSTLSSISETFFPRQPVVNKFLKGAISKDELLALVQDYFKNAQGKSAFEPLLGDTESTVGLKFTYKHIKKKSDFARLEKYMYSNGLLSKDYHYHSESTSKRDVARLVLVLKEKDYFKKFGRKGKFRNIDYARFIAGRYGLKLEQEIYQVEGEEPLKFLLKPVWAKFFSD